MIVHQCRQIKWCQIDEDKLEPSNTKMSIKNSSIRSAKIMINKYQSNLQHDDKSNVNLTCNNNNDVKETCPMHSSMRK